MFEKYFEQTERFFRPMNEIWSLQSQAAESISKTNSALMTEVWQGGWDFAQSLSSQKNFDDALKLQQEYWDLLTHKLQHAADENQSLLTDVNQKIADVIQQPDRKGRSTDAAAAAGKAKSTAGSSSAKSEASKKSSTAAKTSSSKASSAKSETAKKSTASESGAASASSNKSASGSSKSGAGTSDLNKGGSKSAVVETSSASTSEKNASKKSGGSSAKAGHQHASTKSGGGASPKTADHDKKPHEMHLEQNKSKSH